MDTNDFDQKLVAKIKQDNIAPKPRWHFLLKNYVIWAIGLLALLIGAAAVSVMIYLFKYNGWEIQEETHKSLWDFFLLTLPYFWIIFLSLFVFILYYNFKHTKHGYRYPVWFMVMASILSSIILGSLFFLAGLGEKIDNVLGERAPLYDIVINRHVDFWFKPEEGRLTGIITKEKDEQGLIIFDAQMNPWQVIMQPDFPSEELRLNQPVDIIGRVSGPNKFEAEIIRPVRPGRSFFSRPNIKGDRPGCPPKGCHQTPEKK